MESVISIRDSGRWIGDVDVTAALRGSHIYIVLPQAPCSHPEEDNKPKDAMKSMECWDELQECKSGLAVVRVHGNWLARLAVTAYLAQRADKCEGRGAKIKLLPSHVCWSRLEHDSHSIIYIY